MPLTMCPTCFDMGQSLLHIWYILVFGTQPAAANFDLLTHKTAVQPA